MTMRDDEAQATRRRILDRTGWLISINGTDVSLSDIAKAVGISKSGLLHHFPSKDQLFHAVVEDMIVQFRAKVASHIAMDEPAEGRFLRAYLRTLLIEGPTINGLCGPTLPWIGVTSDAAIRKLVDEDNKWWSDQVAQDRLDPAKSIVIERAADGIAAAMASNQITQEQAKPALDLLMLMATNNDTETIE
ncbi:TetR/AcrR family transcriptional regulator [Corynebacterium pelargi]|uniref:Transcriptional regulator BetI n=1 Tax=Corynebacterium pelargi TaxID=1471400 RepID=A0A410W6D5_9CORY|nr:TetR/AcrR family transcriptional regulator [Corynebacterium pelargi]QAU51525.1 transcriptional regulator BetI [Corynebacterium pelargi]GGG79762.1 TetR family transcriptional regulator [Corynebacterium pelargi]